MDRVENADQSENNIGIQRIYHELNRAIHTHGTWTMVFEPPYICSLSINTSIICSFKGSEGTT